MKHGAERYMPTGESDTVSEPIVLTLTPEQYVDLLTALTVARDCQAVQADEDGALKTSWQQLQIDLDAQYQQQRQVKRYMSE